MIQRFLVEEAGQDIIEYAFLAAFISVVTFAIVVGIGEDVESIYTAVDGVTGSAATASS